MNIINPNRVCPECGAGFIAHHGRQAFCSSAHKAAFEARNASRGKIVLPLLQVFRKGKRGRSEATAYAFSQICALADLWNEQDRLAGRRPDVVTDERRRNRWAAVDAIKAS